MKEIKAHIRPECLERVIDRLEEAGVRDITVIRADALGAPVDNVEESARLTRKYSERYSAVAKLEIVCRGEEAERFVRITQENASTGLSGDGRAFITHIDRAVSSRTGAEGEEAL